MINAENNKILARSKNIHSTSQFVTYILLGMIFLSTPIAEAIEPNGAMSRGLAGAGRAVPFGIEGAMMNPANFPSANDYHLSGFFEETELGDAGFRRDMTAALLDRNPEALFPAMVSYRETEVRDSEGIYIEEMDVQLAIGKPYTEYLAVGIGLRYLDQDLRGGEDDYYIQGNAGFLYRATKGLSFGLVFDNVFDNHTVGLQPSTAIATAYNHENMFRVAADLVVPSKSNPDRKGIASIGFESLLVYGFVLRGGYRLDNLAEEKFWAAGVGWNGPRLFANYGFERNVEDDSVFTHSLDLGVFF